MTAGESIQNVLQKLTEARALLAQPTVEALERCRAEMGEAAVTLHEMIASGSPMDSAEADCQAGLREIQEVASELDARVRHGSRFCAGLVQMRVGVGYTNRGSAVMAELNARTFEL